MMKRVRFLVQGALAVSILMGLQQTVRAEDDLLDILNGPKPGAAANAAPGSVAPQKTESELVQVIGQPNGEQNIFISYFDKGEFAKALYQWPSAFESSSFAKTPSGQALNAYVMFKNGIRITALERLLEIANPEQIAPPILKLWKDAVPDTSDVWALIATPAALWKPFWSEQFGISAEIRVLSRQVYGSEQIDLLKGLIKRTQVDTRERAWLEWQLVLALANGDDSATAGRALAHLMKAPNNPVGDDLMTITAARLLYQNGFLDAALKYDEKIPKSSDYWFDAQEEMGWAYIRKGEPQNAIALTKTLMSPNFENLIGPEPLFLRSLALLKVCDYPEVSKTLDAFKARFKARAQTMQTLADNGETPAVQSFIDRTGSKRLKQIELGADAARLPRFVTRDEVVAQSILTEKALKAEAKTASDLYLRSSVEASAQIGPQARLQEFKKSIELRAQNAHSQTVSRIRSLAQDEVTEISQILQKLHVVEAEVLTRLQLVDRAQSAVGAKPDAVAGSTGSRARDQVWFPAEQEVWFDELSNYRVDIKKGCLSAKR